MPKAQPPRTARKQEKPRAPAPTPKAQRPQSQLWIYLALLLATISAYAQVRQFEFVNFDDPDYVVQNPHVRGGLTPPDIAWAFTSTDFANWFPVTWLSHMLDCQFFGLRSGWHHLTSVAIHALAACMLFAFLHRATQARWPSVFVAFVFALHPLHVESVSWIAERKDVLSAFFWFSTLCAYVRYTERPDLSRYLLTLALFALGLMSKPMLVTLPLVLLLLDVWPLRRVSPWRDAQSRNALLEKAPFFALSAAAAVTTYLVQRASGAVEQLSAFPFPLRAANALVSYAVYVCKTFWPTHLAVFYPYSRQIPAWLIFTAALLVLGISALVLWSFRRYPYLSVGWFWYLITLLPVIGLIQVGTQARADRYTYIPMVGLSIMLAWGAADLVSRWPRAKTLVLASAAAAGASCYAATYVQVQYWRDSESLFQHALNVTAGNYVAEHNLGVALSSQPSRLPEAISHLQAALRIAPNSARAHTDLGNALANTPDRLEDAIAEYKAALRIAPDSAITHNDLANTLTKIPGRMPQAIAEYQQALHLKPDYAEAHNNLGSALAETAGRLPEAIAQFKAALSIQPDYAQARTNLELALSKLTEHAPDATSQANTAEARGNRASELEQIPGRLPEAISEYQAALRLKPDSADLHYNLGLALAKTGTQSQEAISEYETALRLKPDYAEAHNNLGVALSQIPGRLPEAIAQFEAALRINPAYADAQYNLGIALANTPGRIAEAIQHVEAALRLKPDPEIQRTLERLRTAQRR